MTTIHLDKAKATSMARNLRDHLRSTHDLKLGHAQALTAVAKTLGYNETQVMTAALKRADAPPAEPPRQITFVNITHDHGTTTAVTAPEDAEPWLASWCLTYWEQERLHEIRELADPSRMTDDEVIEAYFEHTGDDYALSTVDLGKLDSPRSTGLPERLAHIIDADTPEARHRGWGVRDGRIVATSERFADDAAAADYVRCLAARGVDEAVSAMTAVNARIPAARDVMPAPESEAGRYLVTTDRRWSELDGGRWVETHLAYDLQRDRLAAIQRSCVHLAARVEARVGDQASLLQHEPGFERRDAIPRGLLEIPEQGRIQGPRYLATPEGHYWHETDHTEDTLLQVAYDRVLQRVVSISRGCGPLADAIGHRISELDLADARSLGLELCETVPQPLRATRGPLRYVYTDPARPWWTIDRQGSGEVIECRWIYDRHTDEIVHLEIRSGSLTQPEQAAFRSRLAARLRTTCRTFLDDPHGIGAGWVRTADLLSQITGVPRAGH